MKKMIILMLLVFMLGLTGCGEQAEPEAPETTTQGPEVSQTDLPSDRTPSAQPVEEVEKPELSAKIKAIIDKSENIDSLEYSYSDWKKGEPGFYSHVYIKGDSIKHEFGSMQNIGTAEYYNAVYLDSETKEAIGYCEKDNLCDGQQPVILEYSDFDTLTPFEVLEELEYGEETGSAMFDDRDTKIIEYIKDGKKVRVWLWEYKGLPLKYEVTQDGEKVRTISYESLLYNNVADADVVHQTVSR